MKRLLLSLLFIPFFTSSSWANPVKTVDSEDYQGWEDSANSDGDMNDASVGTKNYGMPSVKQGQKRKSGWGQKPTSNKRKSVGSKSKSR